MLLKQALPKSGEKQYMMAIWMVLRIQIKYLLTKLNDGIVIIDQHVAHERILYDSAIKGLQKFIFMNNNKIKVSIPPTLLISSIGIIKIR